MQYALQRLDGRITDLQYTPHTGREADGTTIEVLLVESDPPWLYDAERRALVHDTATASAAAALEAEENAAGAAIDIEKPQFRAMIQAALADLEQERLSAIDAEALMQEQVNAYNSDPALPASPTVAQLRTAVNALASRGKDAAQTVHGLTIARRRSSVRVTRIIRALATLLRTPIGS